MIVVWLYPHRDQASSRKYLCRDCLAFGVAALVDAGEVLATTSRPLTLAGGEVVRPNGFY